MGIRMTSKAWFGPKRVAGWGWSIRTWQGGVVTAIFLALLFVSFQLWPGSRLLLGCTLIGLYLVVVLLTGDPPGGPRDHGP